MIFIQVHQSSDQKTKGRTKKERGAHRRKGGVGGFTPERKERWYGAQTEWRPLKKFKSI